MEARCIECHQRRYGATVCMKCYSEASDLWNYVVLNHPRIFNKFKKKYSIS